MSRVPTPERIVERFLAASGWQLAERACGRYELSDDGITLSIAWDSPAPQQWLVELAWHEEEGLAKTAAHELEVSSPEHLSASLRDGLLGLKS